MDQPVPELGRDRRAVPVQGDRHLIHSGRKCRALATASVDRMLVNPPWGRQVPPRGALAARPETLWAQARRVLRPDGRLVALLHDDDQGQAVARHGFTVTHTRTIRLAGTLTTVLVASS